MAVKSKAPDDFLVWGISFIIGCALLFCLPKILLVLIIGGLIMGTAAMKA